MSSFKNASFVIGSATLIRLICGVLTIKIIAITTGPEGLGVVGQMMSLVSICLLLAAGGIQNGIVSRLPMLISDGHETSSFLSTAIIIACVWSLVFFFILFVFSAEIGRFLFKNSEYDSQIKLLALCQFVLAFGAVCTGVIIGQKKTSLYAIISTVSVLFGMAGLSYLTSVLGVSGALYGLLFSSVAPSIVLFLWIVFVRKNFDYSFIRNSMTLKDSLYLSKYTIMIVVSAVCMPVAQILLRDKIHIHGGWSGVGIWQASIKFSDAIMQFFAALLSSYFLPRVSEIKNKEKLKSLINEAYCLVLPLLILIGIVVLFFSDLVVKTLLSGEFQGVTELLRFQVVGDLFRGLSLVLGYLAVSRGSLKLYIIAEVFQAFLMLGIGFILIPAYGPVGAVCAYAFTYFIYFILCVVVYNSYLRRI